VQVLAAGMDSARLEHLIRVYRGGLLDDSIPFWLRHGADPEFGDWFGYLHRDGRLSSPVKGSLFKGCFHVPRQHLVCWRIAEAIAAGRVGRFGDAR